jgi:hypothetical protein
MDGIPLGLRISVANSAVVFVFNGMTSGSLFWTLFWAGAGGGIIVVGLLFETVWDKSWYRTIAHLRHAKMLKTTGAWMVILGVALETVVAIVSSRQVWINDPMRQPVASAFAHATLIISEVPRKDFDSIPTDWSGGIMFITSTQLNNNVLLSLEAGVSDVSWWNMGSTTNREWRIQYHENPFNFLQPESARNKIHVGQFEDVRALVISMPFKTNMVVHQGEVTLTVNDHKWTFEIPEQTPKFNIITMHLIPDGKGLFKTEVMRVPIGDFVIPPRFTNLFYDGK